MKTQDRSTLSKSRIQRIRAQGYIHQSDEEISDLSIGNRFAFQVCAGLLTVGVTFASIPILLFVFVVAIFGLVLPNHPFDYIYNYLVAPKLNKPQLPRRSGQLKFACLMAAVWLVPTIAFFKSGSLIAGYALGAALLAVAVIVAITDFCIPSTIYNALFPPKLKYNPNNATNYEYDH